MSDIDPAFEKWVQDYQAEHGGASPTGRDYEIYQNMDTIQANWQQAHGFTPINWQSYTRMGAGPSNNFTSFDYPYPQRGVGGGYGGGYGMSAGDMAKQEERNKQKWQEDYNQYLNYQQNFLNAVRTGNYFSPYDLQGFGPQNWWQQQEWVGPKGEYGQEGYESGYGRTVPRWPQDGKIIADSNVAWNDGENRDYSQINDNPNPTGARIPGGAFPSDIPQGSWLWNLPSQYRQVISETSPELQSAIGATLWPEYQRRENYSLTPGQSRWMR